MKPNAIVSLVLFFPLAVLYVNQVIETWNHGNIFAEWRERVEQSDGFFASVLGCMFCFSHWVGLFTAVLTFNVVFDSIDYNIFALQLVYGLAVARGAQWLNDFGHGYNRTPKPPSTIQLIEEFQELQKLGKEPEEHKIE